MFAKRTRIDAALGRLCFARKQRLSVRCKKNGCCRGRSKYTVSVFHDKNGVTHPLLRTNDRSPMTDWRGKQEIKNQLCGPEREGFELYPAESRLVDTSNQYHIWVMPEGVTIPFGF
jgi:hypothetical protein